MNEKPEVKTRGIAFVLPVIGAAGIVVIALVNLFSKAGIRETFTKMGAAVPPLTNLIHSTPVMLAVFVFSVLVLFMTPWLKKSGKSGTAFLLATACLVVILLEALALYRGHYIVAAVIG